MQTNSRWSGPPVKDVVWEAVQDFTGGDVNIEFAIKDIEAVALKKYPDFKVSNVGVEITAGCVNSASRHHHSPDIDRYWKVARGVYRLYKSDQPVGLDNVLEKINEIAKKSADGDYIYRGEQECYDKVSSSLYREFPDVDRVDTNIAHTQENILAEAKAYIGQTDNTEESRLSLLTDIQHFGGKTNLIDFTEDYLIALFFACDGSHDEEGRVILLKRKSDDYAIREPRRTNNRVESQKSVFVESPTGFVEPDRVVPIPMGLKFPMLNYLEKYHRVSIATIYNDLHGFIRRSVNTEFLKGLTCQRKADEAKTNEEKHKFLDDAIKHYTEAEKLMSEKLKFDYSIVYNNRGVAYAAQAKFDAAIQDYDRAIELNFELTDAYINLGSAYGDKGEFDKAIQVYNTVIEKVIEKDSEDAMIYYNLGNVYRLKGEFDAAILHYGKAIALDPEKVEAYNNRGTTYGIKHEFDSAIQDFNIAIELNPELTDTYGNLGNVYRLKGEFDAAILHYGKVIALDPEDAKAYNFRGLAYGAKGEFDAAIEDFNRAIDLAPEDASAYCNRGEAWLHLKEWQKAKVDLTTAKDKGCDIIASFQDDYESVEAFEAKHGVQVPEDIAALLSGNTT